MDTYKLVFIAAVMLAFLYAAMQMEKPSATSLVVAPPADEAPPPSVAVPSQEELAQYALECLENMQTDGALQ